jgi:hypothetical protein
MRLTKLSFFLCFIVIAYFSCTTGNGSEASDEEADYPKANEVLDTTTRGPISRQLASGIPPDYHLFVETSGSMDGYYAADHSTLNSTLTTLVTELYNNRSQNLLDSLHFAYLGSGNMQRAANLLKEFNTKFNSRAAIKLKSSEFDYLFDTVLNSVGRGDVSILVSDLIFSPPRKDISQIQNFLDYQKATLDRLFDQRLDTMDLSTLIIQCSGTYSGIYWDNQYKQIPLQDAQRPYYVVVTGNAPHLQQLISAIPPEGLPGFRNSWLLVRPSNVPVNAKISFSQKYRKGSNYDPVSARSISHAEAGENNEFQFPVLINLDQWSMNEAVIADKSNYHLTDASSNYEVVDVVKLDASERSRKPNAGYTHFLILKTKRLRSSQDIDIRFYGNMPAWVASSSTTNDQAIGKDTSQLSKTFGLSYLVGGIFDAYYGNTRNRPLFSFTIHVEK